MSSRVPTRRLGGNVPGAIVIATVGMVDLVVLTLILLHMLLAIVLPSYARRMASDKERYFLTSPLGMYIISLFIGNFISALGGVIEVEWIGSQEIVQGPMCSTQAFFSQLGGNATALWLGVISMSALSTFLLRARSLRAWAALLTIGILWTFMIVFDSAASAIFAGNSRQFFYGIAGLWCWITPSHRMARLFMQYIWMWLWSLVSAVCFGLVYLSVRGNIVVRKDAPGKKIKWNKSLSGSWLNKSEEYEGLVGAVGKTMCWFPICYIILTIPISVSRMAETFGFRVPGYAFVFAAVNTLLIGIVNTAIYFALRHSLKRGSGLGSSDDTLRGSYNSDKAGTESFEAVQEKRSSPTGKTSPYPWTTTPTKAWIPGSPNRGQDVPTSPSPPYVAYAVTSGDDAMVRSSIYSNAPPRQVPVSSKMAQRTRSFHRPMESVSTITSSGTVMEHPAKLTTVAEDVSTKQAVGPQLRIPPPVLLATKQSNPSPNIISPSELGKLTSTPRSPNGGRGHKRSETDTGAYSGPRAISPDLNALLKEDPKDSKDSPVLSGPPPPPRKQKRALTPSVPLDVDESDVGSLVSAKSSVEEIDHDETRPVSIGDVTTRTPEKRTDSMNTFWAAYDPSSPKTPDVRASAHSKSRDTMGTFWAAYGDSSPKTADMPMPDLLRRDTMRSFWAAYEDPLPRTPDMPWPTDAVSIRSEAVKSWRSTARSSADFRINNSSVFLRPAISAVALRPTSPHRETLHPPAPPSKDTAPAKPEALAKPTAALKPNPAHRRSRSLTSMPTVQDTSDSGKLRPAANAITRYGSPGPTLREGPAKHAHTPSDSSRISDIFYRPPRPQPGYV